MRAHPLMMVSILAFGGFTLAADNVQVSQGLKEVEAAKDQSEILSTQSLTNEQKERVRFINDRLTNAISLLQQSLGGGQGPLPPGGGIEIFRSDSCSSSLLGTANAFSNCAAKFAQAGDAWGVRVGGKCLNIADVPAVAACEGFKAGADPQAAVLHRSDSCNGAEIAIVNTLTECSNFSPTGSDAWAVKLADGKCYNISDTAPARACEAFKASSNLDAIKIFRSDSCSSTEFIAAVDGRTNCQNLEGLPDAWAIQVNGQCQNISDLKIVDACERFKP